MTNDHSHCPSLPLAASDLGHITICPNCNVVTVTVQSISIRFEPPAFDQLARMIGQARAALLRPSYGFTGAHPDVVEVSRSMADGEPSLRISHRRRPP